MRLLLSVALFFATSVLAQSNDDPSRFCEVNSCTSKMLQISQDYKNGNGDFSNLEISAYSGACYHLNPMYYPTDKHYGVMVFENKNSEFLNTGFFGFFYTEDPYLSSPPAEIKSDLEKKNYRSFVGQIYEDRSELSFDSGGVKINYWFRTSRDLKTMYLIGRWQGSKVYDSLEQFMFCEWTQRRSTP